MYIEEEFHLSKDDKTSKVTKDIGDLIGKIRGKKDLKIMIIIKEDELAYFYSNSGGTTSDSKFW